MLAMFSSFWAWSLWRLDSLVSLPLTAALLFLLGIATCHGLIRWVLGAPMLAQIFATFGLAIFLRAAAQALWSVDVHLVDRDRGITVIFIEQNVRAGAHARPPRLCARFGAPRPRRAVGDPAAVLRGQADLPRDIVHANGAHGVAVARGDCRGWVNLALTPGQVASQTTHEGPGSPRRQGVVA
jgi:hypothetical protein